MKKNYRICLLILIGLFLTSLPVGAELNFKEFTKDRIDPDELKVEKEKFFSFIKNSIMKKPFGLGAYGRVSVNICEMPYNGRKLLDYSTKKGVGFRFLSNPSCSQTVLRRLLVQNYGLDPGRLSSYGDRQCILEIEKIFSPIMEFYTIRYEEKSKHDCRSCEDNEQRRLQKIISIQQEISAACDSEKNAIQRFLTDLDAAIEGAFRQKNKSASP